MELVDLLKEEIRKLASEENININKLNEYMYIYERLKLYQVTSVQEIENDRQNMAYQFGADGIMTPAPRIGRPMVGVGPRDNLGGILDIFKETIHMQNKPHKKDEISDYIFWFRFLKDIREDIREFCYSDDREKMIEDLDKLVTDICIRTVQLMRKKLEDNIAGKTDNEKIGISTIIPEAVTI